MPNVTSYKMPYSWPQSGSLVPTVTLKGTHKFLTAVMFLLYILEETALTKVTCLSKLYYQTSFRDPTFSGATNARTSQVRKSVMLSLLMA
jgi:hypothetical protein